MSKKSAGVILYRRAAAGIELLLVHPGGPYWAKKDLGTWSIPKGEFEDDEDPLDAARRELLEETGFSFDGDFLPLGSVIQKSGKTVWAWALERDCDASAVRSNTFTMEWPPKSGRQAQFPEVDRAEWFAPDEAKRKLVSGQAAFVDRLCDQLDAAD